MSTHVPPHAIWGDGQSHVPAMHVVGGTHEPEQHGAPGTPHIMHAPATHAVPPPHARAHAPQFRGSL
jgi:hypothetical protein